MKAVALRDSASAIESTVPATVRPTVLVIGPLPPPFHGGAVATKMVLSSQLSDRFRLVHVDTTDARGLENIGRFDLGNVRLAVQHLVRYLGHIRREQPDLVYVPLAQSRLGFLRDALFLQWARLLQRRLIVHFHGSGFRRFYEDTDPLTGAAIRSSLRGVVSAIVLSEHVRSALVDLLPGVELVVVPNGIEDPYRGELRRDVAPRAGTGRVLYLGTLMAEKGFLDVLAAAELLAPHRPGVSYTLAGAFFRRSDQERAERYLRNGMRNRVQFAGVVEGDAKADLLRAADIFVFPSFAQEGHPYVILEAMAAGLPIITTARATVAGTIVDGETGVIVPERDPRALSAAIGRLVDSPLLRARLGAAARARFLERYTLRRWVSAMTNAFEAALAAD